MKKTIAKIMAAAMVLSTIAAPNVFAADTYTIKDAKDLAANATITLDGRTIFSSGSWTSGNIGADEDDLIEDDEDYIVIGTDEMTALSAGDADALYGTAYQDNYVNLTASIPVIADAYDEESKTIDGTKNAVTAVSAAAGTLTSSSEYFMYNLLAGTTGEFSVSDNTEFKDVVVNARSSRDLVEWRVRFVNGRGWVAAPFFNTGYAATMEIIRQLNAGNIINIPMAITIQANGRVFDTGWTLRWWFGTNNGNVNDDYWNAIVKLKADNNRYTPIRVHVDAVDGSIAGLNGLYVQIVNGTKVQFVTANQRLIATTDLTTTALADNKLVIQDVQTNDLALLKSDAAKGKNLMLDEAFLFRTQDNVNNNSLSGAGDQVYDFSVLGQNTDLGTISIGKISDIRSRLFKDCKEKLVHAKNVKWIRNGAFRKNKQLKKAILSDDVSMKKINEKSFYDCKKLNTVKVKVNTLKQVGKNAFGGSTDKKGLKFNLKAGNKTQYNKAVKLFKKSGVKKAKFRKI